MDLRPTVTLVVVIASVAVSCATPHDGDAPNPVSDEAGTDAVDASVDLAEQVDATIEAAMGDDGLAEGSVGDTGAEAAEGCGAEAGAQEGPCSPGETQTGRCGRCGARERVCDSSGAWREWTDCSESPEAECALCEESQVACGFCGVRPLTCVLSGETCRWVLGFCESSGACSPGSFEADSSGCEVTEVRTRWCGKDCEWEAWQACSSQPPGWDLLPSASVGPREGSVQAVTNTAWLIWGGRDPLGAALADGARFDAASDTWTALPEAVFSESPDGGAADGAVSQFLGRSGAASTWTGQQLLIWGGLGAAGVLLDDGARFLPSTGTWSPMSSIAAPSPRAEASMIWDDTDGVAIVWGGRGASGAATNEGGRYSAASDKWSPMAPAPIPARLAYSAVWDPSRERMIVWGGRAGGVPRRDGAEYNPKTDSWSQLPDAPIAREGHLAFWDPTRERMLVWFGMDGYWTGHRGDGAAWTPSTGSWVLLPDISVSGYPVGAGLAARFGAGHVWACGGDGNGSGSSTAAGARYDAEHDAWSALPEMNAPRSGHAAAFFKDRWIVWGGRPASSGWVDSTERLRPMP